MVNVRLKEGTAERVPAKQNVAPTVAEVAKTSRRESGFNDISVASVVSISRSGLILCDDENHRTVHQELLCYLLAPLTTLKCWELFLLR
jgi:hypothetical protein